jgi:Cu/Ag efflux protein CusF
MKKITTLFTALIVAFSMTAFAAEKAADVTPADAKTAQTDEKKAEGTKKAHHRKHHKNHYQGEVTAVDAKAGTVTVSRGEKTFTADEKVLSGVKVGDKVSVKFTEKDGQFTATGIKPAKAHHMKKEVKNAEEKKAEEKK